MRSAAPTRVASSPAAVVRRPDLNTCRRLVYRVADALAGFVEVMPHSESPSPQTSKRAGTQQIHTPSVLIIGPVKIGNDRL